VHDDKPGTSLFRIAYKIGDKDMLSLLMNHKLENGKNVVAKSIRETDVIMNEIILSLRNGLFLK
jgi:hypothetical protein